MKLTKRIMLTVLSLAFALSMVFTVCLLSGKTVEASSTAYVPAKEIGLTEVTMNSITPVNGVTEEGKTIDYIDFDGLGVANDIYMVLEYKGNNIPTVAINATQAYSRWNGEDYSTTGYVFNANYEVDNNGDVSYSSDNLRFSKGFVTTSSNSIVTSYGAYLRSTQKTYVMVMGIRRVNYWYRYLEVYIYSVNADGTLTEEKVWADANDHTSTAARGTHVVIYPKIGGDTATFKYSVPKNSIKDVVQSLGDSVKYKNALAEKFNLGDVSLTSASLDKVTTRGEAATNVDYVFFDDYASKSAYFLVDFVGQNVPNFAFAAGQAYSEWPAIGSSPDYTSAGILLMQSTRYALATGGNYRTQSIVVVGGLTTAEYKTHTDMFTGIENYDANKHYIMVIGMTSNAWMSFDLFEENNGVLSLVGSISVASGAYTYSGISNTKLVIYPNVAYGPDTINFKYAIPQPSIEGLIEELPDSYAYKSQLKQQIIGNTATVKGADGETVKAENFKGSYTLPEYSNAGVIGYNVDGKLYAKGDVITATTDITVTEVELNLNMEDGAKVRVSDNGTQYGGLRFTVTADAETVDTYGIAVKGQIIPTDLIDGTYDVGETGAKSVDLTTFDTEDGVNTYCITLTNVLYTNYNRAFSALAYATVTYEDGDTATVTTAYDAQKNSRSIYQVAVKASNDTTEDYTTTQRGILNSYISYTVNLVNVEGSVSVATAEDGLNDVSLRKYTAVQDGNTVTITISDLSARLTGITHASLTVYNGTAFARVLVPVTVDGTTATATYTLG